MSLNRILSHVKINFNDCVMENTNIVLDPFFCSTYLHRRLDNRSVTRVYVLNMMTYVIILYLYTNIAKSMHEYLDLNTIFSILKKTTSVETSFIVYILENVTEPN